MEQQIEFCTNPEGARIAYVIFGHGPTIVLPSMTLGILNTWHVSPDLRHVFENLARYHTIVLYDMRGAGLSERNRTVFTLESELQDLEAVINHLKLDKVILDGSMWGGPFAVAYAAKYPERVTHLILYGTYAYYGKYISDEVKSSLISLVRQQNNWFGIRSFMSLAMPQASTEEIELLTAIFKEFITPENFARVLQMRYTLDVTKLCPNVEAPTIVIHHKGDMMIDFKAGLELASLIPHARFVPLEGILKGASAGDSLVRTKFEFLGDPVPDKSADSSGKAVPVSDPPGRETAQKKVNWLRLDHPLVYIIATVLASVIAGIILTLFKC